MRAAATLALAAASADAFTTRPGLKHLGASDASAPMTLHIKLAPARHDALTELESRLMTAADPDSPSYSNWLSRKQLVSLVGASHRALAEVQADLAKLGVPATALKLTGAGDWIEVETTVGAAAAFLETTYHAFEQEGTGRVINRAPKCTIPSRIARFVTHVEPCAAFPMRGGAVAASRPAPKTKKLRNGAAGVSGVTPSSIRKAYGLGSTMGMVKSSKQGIGSFLGQYISPSDTSAFLGNYYPAAANTSITFVGPNDATNPGIEASLDIEYITSMSGVNTTAWYTDGTRPGDNEPFLAWLTNVSSLPDDELPQTISVSYGDNENTVDYGYASAVNVEFQKLGARGVSIFYSSGDGGVAGSQSSPCPNGQFIPTFPAGSPYVTSVGATEDTSTAAAFSSGGFSNYWTPPAYAQAAFSAYLGSAPHLPAASAYNATGNGFPVVSAFGVDFNIVCGQQTMQVDGTSCSSPTFAGVVALLNDARLAAGKKPLGFMNPLIFKYGHKFLTDIKLGNNPGCNTNGFFATNGWDPVTGFGTPNFPAMKAFVLSLP